MASRPDMSGKAGWVIYPFFGVHVLMFGLSGFLIAYGLDPPNVALLFVHGGFAILVYMAFYLSIFGLDEVKWMLVNAALGVLGIYAQIGWILDHFGRRIDDYPWPVHIVPFVYYVLYTFLLRQFLLDITGSRRDSRRRALVDGAYVLVSLSVYGLMLWRMG